MIVRWEVLAYVAERPPGRGFVLRLADAQGRTGLGEARALEGFGSSPDRLHTFLRDRDAVPGLLDDLQAAGRVRRAQEDVPVEALFAAETALLDLAAQRQEVSLVEHLGFAATRHLCNSLLVGSEPEAAQLLAQGHRNFKVKARGLDRECLALLRRLVEESGGEARVRVDANGSWDRISARDFLAEAPAEAIVFLEQPFPMGDLDNCAWLQEHTGIPVAMDEGADSEDAIAAAARAGAARLVVIKPMYRGLHKALELAAVANDCGLGVCITHAMDGTVGRVAAMHVAAAVDDLCGESPWPHGLYAPGLAALADEPEMRPDCLVLPRGIGLGCGRLRDRGLDLVSTGP